MTAVFSKNDFIIAEREIIYPSIKSQSTLSAWDSSGGAVLPRFVPIRFSRYDVRNVGRLKNTPDEHFLTLAALEKRVGLCAFLPFKEVAYRKSNCVIYRLVFLFVEILQILPCRLLFRFGKIETERCAFDSAQVVHLCFWSFSSARVS